MKRAEFQLETLTCPTCIRKIEGTVGKMKGVKGARVLFNSSKVKLGFDEAKVTADDIQDTIEKLGYEVKSQKVS